MSDPIDVMLGRRLRARRRLLGMTLEQVAGACGVRFRQIQKYETAANKMSASMLMRVAAALEVTPSYFYDGLEPWSPPALLGGRPTLMESRTFQAAE